MDAFRAQLESQAPPKPEEQDGDDGEVDMSGQPLTGEELRGLVVARWGRPYDTRITQRRNKINQLKLYLQVRVVMSTCSYVGACSVSDRCGWCDGWMMAGDGQGDGGGDEDDGGDG